MQSKKQNLEKSRRVSLAIYMIIVMVMSLYTGLHLGVVYMQMPNLVLWQSLEHISRSIHLSCFRQINSW